MPARPPSPTRCSRHPTGACLQLRSSAGSSHGLATVQDGALCVFPTASRIVKERRWPVRHSSVPIRDSAIEAARAEDASLRCVRRLVPALSVPELNAAQMTTGSAALIGRAHDAFVQARAVSTSKHCRRTASSSAPGSSLWSASARARRASRSPNPSSRSARKALACTSVEDADGNAPYGVPSAWQAVMPILAEPVTIKVPSCTAR